MHFFTNSTNLFKLNSFCLHNDTNRYLLTVQWW